MMKTDTPAARAAVLEYYSCADLGQLASRINAWSKGKGFICLYEDIPKKLALVHSEVSEALEADRTSDWQNFEEELADILIRVLDLTGNFDIDIETAIQQKMLKNESRPHKHGKRY